MLKKFLAAVSLGALALGIGGCATTNYSKSDDGVYRVAFGDYWCIASLRTDEKEIINLMSRQKKGVDFRGEKIMNSEGGVKYLIRECDAHFKYVTLDRHGVPLDEQGFQSTQIEERVNKTYNLLKKCERLLEDRYKRDF